MPHYNTQEDPFSSSHFLSSTPSSRKSPSRQSISVRRSTASLRTPQSLANGIDDDAPNGRHHSLAHELAVALMPEPSAGSKLLAEEFGIEFDEGAEGIDEPIHHHHHLEDNAQVETSTDDIPELSFADEIVAQPHEASFEGDAAYTSDETPGLDPIFDSPTVQRRRHQQKKTIEKDAMEVLSHNLESTDKFLDHLRTVDTESSSLSSQPKLERLASDIIRHMNDSIKDREGQLRVLLECEREFRKIGGEVGGSDILGQLDALDGLEELSDTPSTYQPLRLEPHLDTLEEEPTSPAPRRISHNHHSHSHHDWELDPDTNHLGDADTESEPATSPIKDSFPPPPAINGPTTPAKTVPQLTHLRSFTSSLVSSLSVISEQAQVNGVATAEAGRKIRSLKNKLGGLRTDWDNAERSRAKIDRWEAGIMDNEGPDGTSTTSPSRLLGRRVDGRKIVQEHLQAFELALADAALKTQAIMAR